MADEFDVSTIGIDGNRTGITERDPLSVVMRSGAWERLPVAGAAAPVVRRVDDGARLLAKGLRRLNAPEAAAVPVLSAWMYLIALRRLADFDGWRDPTSAFHEAASRVVEALARGGVPEPDADPVPKLFHRADVDRLLMIGSELGADHRFFEQLYRTVAWAEIGLIRAGAVEHGMLCERACLPPPAPDSPPVAAGAAPLGNGAQLRGILLYDTTPGTETPPVALGPEAHFRVAADAACALELEFSNRPDKVSVIERTGARQERVIVVRELGHQAEAQPAPIRVPLPNPGRTSQTSTSVFEIHAGNGDDGGPIAIGELTVTRVVTNPSVSLTATATELLARSDRVFPPLERALRVENGRPPVVLADESVTFTVEAAAGSFGAVTQMRVEALDGQGRWLPIGDPAPVRGTGRMRHRFTAALGEEARQIRAVMELADRRQVVSPAIDVVVAPAPVFLICLAKGGSKISSIQAEPTDGNDDQNGGGGGGGGDETPCQPSSGHHPDTEGDGLCDLDAEIGTRRLGLRALADGVCRDLRVTTADGTCLHRTNPYGGLGTIVVGAYDNSLTDGADEDDHFTWQKQLSAQAAAARARGVEKDHVIFVGHSHGGAAFAHLVKDDWPWPELDVELLISIDATDEGGAIDSVGDRPKRVVNFYQTSSPWWFQNGARIEEADVQYNLSDRLSHTDMDSGYFVQCRSAQAIREVVAEVRERYRQNYDNVGGDSGPAVASGGPHSLDVFVRGRHRHELVHRFHNGAAWSGWINLGGDLASGPAVTAGGPHVLDVFIRGKHNHELVHRFYDGQQWSGWINLGGDLASGPAVTAGGPHELDVFVRGKHNDELVHRFYDGQQWSGWINLGGDLASGPAVTAGGPHVLDVFIRGKHNDELVHRFYDGQQWSGWINLGGDLASAPAVTANGPHVLDVFIRGKHNDELVHRYFNGNTWSGWINLGGDLASAPTVTANGPHVLDVFIRGKHNDELVHRYYNGNTWSGWINLGGDLA